MLATCLIRPYAGYLPRLSAFWEFYAIISSDDSLFSPGLSWSFFLLIRTRTCFFDNGTGIWYHHNVNKKHRQTLESILARPDRKDIHWDDFVSLLKALGADITERGGSILGIRLNGRYAVFHRPHPGNEIYLSMLKRIRRYLAECDISLEVKDD